MTEYQFTVTYRAVNGWARGTMTFNEVAESMDEAVLKMRMSFEKSGYIVESYRVYGFIKEFEGATTYNNLSQQSGDTANTSENCQNSRRPLSADEFIGFVRNMYAINGRQAYISVGDRRFEIDRVYYDTENNIVVEARE